MTSVYNQVKYVVEFISLQNQSCLDRVWFYLGLLLFLTPGLSACSGKYPITQPVSNEQLFTDTIIHQDMTWSGDIGIRGVFVVGRGATLTISPGTTIRFYRVDSNKDGIGDSELRILGRIVALGRQSAPINFRSGEVKPAPLDWSYVLIFASERKNLIQYCRFSDAFTGLQVHFSTATVADSTFTDNNEGIRFGRAKLNFSHNLVRDNNLGIRFTRMEGPADLAGNIITRNRVGIFLVPSSQNIVDFFEPGRTGKPWNEGHLAIRNNNIYDNSDYDLNLGEKQKWDLAVGNNWWGRPDLPGIRNKVFDVDRDDALGRVLLEPVLPSPVRDAGPR